MTISTRQYLWAGNIMVLGLIVWSAVGLGMNGLTRRLAGHTQTAAVVVAAKGQAAPARTLTGYLSIPRFDMFTYNKVKPPPASRPAAAVSRPQAPQASVVNPADYKLLGTIAAGAPPFSFAIIEPRARREQALYRVGDRVGGAEVIEIRNGEVLLREDGQVVRLTLEETASAGAATPRVMAEENHDAQPESLPEADGKTYAQAVGRDQFVVDRSLLSQDVSDLYKLMSQVNVSPYMKNGQPAGFAISSVESGSLFHQLGLRNNDVITSVNGTELRDPDDLMGLYSELQNGGNFEIQLERNRRTRTLRYSLK